MSKSINLSPRQIADKTAIERIEAIYESDPSVTANWVDLDDYQKIDRLAEAIDEVRFQLKQLDSGGNILCLEWEREISEMQKSLLFFQQAIGQAPVEGQLGLFG